MHPRRLGRSLVRTGVGRGRAGGGQVRQCVPVDDGWAGGHALSLAGSVRRIRARPRAGAGETSREPAVATSPARPGSTDGGRWGSRTCRPGRQGPQDDGVQCGEPRYGGLRRRRRRPLLDGWAIGEASAAVTSFSLARCAARRDCDQAGWRVLEPGARAAPIYDIG